MAGWTKQTNKDYHFIAVEETTSKYYGYQFVCSCTAMFSVYSLLKTISQTKGCYLVSSALNVGMSYKTKACLALELTTINVGISTYGKDNTTTVTGAKLVDIPISLLADRQTISDAAVAAVRADIGAAWINSRSLQATV
ncbi:hypothetical protein ACFOGJ_19820 [Marinibaculum pumilum]|uniref:Uncharacterized protein n=1 Tax=Marinibaculum pumilum TaxID=1766165 RepID=A0ABV7L549_9PROT